MMGRFIFFIVLTLLLSVSTARGQYTSIRGDRGFNYGYKGSASSYYQNLNKSGSRYSSDAYRSEQRRYRSDYSYYERVPVPIFIYSAPMPYYYPFYPYYGGYGFYGWGARYRYGRRYCR